MSNNKFLDTVGTITKLAPWDVPLSPEVEKHITTLYDTIHGEGGDGFYQRESRFIHRAIVDDEKKWNCDPISVFLVFVDLAVKDLSLEPGSQALCYLLHRGVKVIGSDGKEQWQNRCYLSVTGYGEILLRQRAGQIRHCDSPTVVYRGDEFTYVERDGRKNVTYGLNLSHDPSDPVACFMKITRLDGSVDYAIILPEAWARLAEYSRKQNARQARDKEKARPNDLYSSGQGGSIDPGFLIAKCVKHAFKSYPKLPIGKGTVMEADLPEQEAMPDYYSMDIPTEAPAPNREETFAAPADHSEGVVVDPDSDNSDAANDGTW